MKDNELAKKILEHIGEENISYFTHCATRLRFNVKDENKIDLNVLNKIEGVIAAQFKNGQLQIIIGAKVKGVFEELSNMINLNETTSKVDIPKKKKILFLLVLKL